MKRTIITILTFIFLLGCADKKNTDKKLTLDEKFIDTISRPYLIYKLQIENHYLKLEEPTYNNYLTMADSSLTNKDTVIVYRITSYLPFGQPEVIIRAEKHNSEFKIISKSPIDKLRSSSDLLNTNKRNYKIKSRKLTYSQFEVLNKLFMKFEPFDFSNADYPGRLFYDGETNYFEVFYIIGQNEIRTWDISYGVINKETSNFSKFREELYKLGDFKEIIKRN